MRTNRISLKVTYTLLSVLLLVSCSPVSLNKLNTTIYETRQQDIQKGALPYNPVIADLKVDLEKKVSGSSIRQITNYSAYELENTKQASLYNAVTNSGADVVVDPVFKINISNNDGKDSKITIQSEVSGFYGKYLNIHKADSIELRNSTYFKPPIKVNNNESVSNNTAKANSFFQKTITDTQNSAEDAAAKKKKKRKLIGWAVGSTLISIIVLGVGLGVGMRNIF
jgi:hypothetical protein